MVKWPKIHMNSPFAGEFCMQMAGGMVKKDQAYVELEAMKMIMPLKARASGKLKQRKSAGGMVQAGELLATLQLEEMEVT